MGPSAALLVHHPPGTRNGPDGAAPTGSTARAEVIAAASHRTARGCVRATWCAPTAVRKPR